MKKWAFLFFFSFLIQNTWSQEWALFPEGQRTFWDNGEEVELYYNDITLPGNFTDRHYFGADYLTHDSSFLCYKNILEQQYGGLENAPVDSLYSTPENWLAKIDGYMLPFFHLAEPGQSWTVESGWSEEMDSIVFICETKIWDNIFDLEDSVKNYSLTTYKNGVLQNYFNNAIYKLSKNYGFIEFYPLQKLIPAEAVFNKKMVGFNNGIAHGFTNSWEDYFGHFTVGQLLKWRTVNALVFSPPPCRKVEEYYIDSILSVEFSLDSVVLEVYRNGISRCWENSISIPEWDDSTFISENIIITYHRSDYDLFFEAPPRWFRFGYFENAWSSGYKTYLSRSLIYNQDSLYHSRVEETNFGFSEPMDGCAYLIGTPTYFPTELKSCLGLVFEGWGYGYSGEAQYKQLIGYTKNGEPFGDVTTSTFSRPNINLKFQISPNPATGILNINLHKWGGKQLELKIIDIAGQVVLIDEINNSFYKIGISELPAGIYFIIITGSELFGRERFVKK